MNTESPLLARLPLPVNKLADFSPELVSVSGRRQLFHDVCIERGFVDQRLGRTHSPRQTSVPFRSDRKRRPAAAAMPSYTGTSSSRCCERQVPVLAE